MRTSDPCVLKYREINMHESMEESQHYWLPRALSRQEVDRIGMETGWLTLVQVCQYYPCLPQGEALFWNFKRKSRIPWNQLIIIELRWTGHSSSRGPKAFQISDRLAKAVIVEDRDRRRGMTWIDHIAQINSLRIRTRYSSADSILSRFAHRSSSERSVPYFEKIARFSLVHEERVERNDWRS